MTQTPEDDDTGNREDTAGRRRFTTMLVLDVVLPLVLYYVLRGIGASQWTALIAGALLPLLRVVTSAVLRRRLEIAGLFTLSLLGVGTAVGLLTADPRLLVARESYLTAVVGIWIIATIWRRPLLYTATTGFMPEKAAAAWHRAWEDSAQFRRTLRIMTLGFGIAFVLDAAARVIMAYTLPLDVVPLLGIFLLVGMLIAVVQGGKAYGKRRLSGILDASAGIESAAPQPSEPHPRD